MFTITDEMINDRIADQDAVRQAMRAVGLCINISLNKPNQQREEAVRWFESLDIEPKHCVNYMYDNGEIILLSDFDMQFLDPEDCDIIKVYDLYNIYRLIEADDYEQAVYFDYLNDDPDLTFVHDYFVARLFGCAEMLDYDNFEDWIGERGLSDYEVIKKLSNHIAIQDDLIL